MPSCEAMVAAPLPLRSAYCSNARERSCCLCFLCSPFKSKGGRRTWSTVPNDPTLM